MSAGERVLKHCLFQIIQATFVPWLIPYKDEAIMGYSKRMMGQVKLEEPYVLVGVSFGGIIVQEAIRFLSLGA